MRSTTEPRSSGRYPVPQPRSRTRHLAESLTDVSVCILARDLVTTGPWDEALSGEFHFHADHAGSLHATGPPPDRPGIPDQMLAVGSGSRQMESCPGGYSRSDLGTFLASARRSAYRGAGTAPCWPGRAASTERGSRPKGRTTDR